MPDKHESTIWWQVYPLGFLGVPIRPEQMSTEKNRSASQPSAQTDQTRSKSSPVAAARGDDNSKARLISQPTSLYGSECRRSRPRTLEGLIPWLEYLLDLSANGLLLGPIFVSETHGYDTLDYFHVDSRLGGDQAFSKLAQACSDRGISLMLDGVFNHVGLQHSLFQDALHGSTSTDMFTIVDGADGTPHYPVFEGHPDLPEFNHRSHSTADLVVQVMDHWLEQGANAWRLDAAYAVPAQFWAEVLSRVRGRYPDSWFLGEMIHGDYAAMVRHSGIDSITQYELWKAIWSSLKEGNFYELDWSLKRHNGFPDSFVPQTFVGNHDVTRIASQVGLEKAPLAQVILMTVGGVPSIYYGDGTGVDRRQGGTAGGGDDAVRPAFPEQPRRLEGTGKAMFELIRFLTSLRQARPWMTSATIRPITIDNRSYSYEVLGDQGQSLEVRLNLGPKAGAQISQAGTLLLEV